MHMQHTHTRKFHNAQPNVRCGSVYMILSIHFLSCCRFVISSSLTLLFDKMKKCVHHRNLVRNFSSFTYNLDWLAQFSLRNTIFISKILVNSILILNFFGIHFLFSLSTYSKNDVLNNSWMNLWQRFWSLSTILNFLSF